MKFLRASPLLSLTLLLSTLHSLSAEDDARKCFVCTEKSSPKCAKELSPSDTELIKECPLGNDLDNPEIAKGCQIFAKQTKEFVHPRKMVVWRDCLYGSDLVVHGMSFTQEDVSKGDTGDKYEVESSVPKMNEARAPSGLPPLLPYDMSVPTGQNFLWVEYHPSRENLSNGMSLESVWGSMGFIDVPKPRNNVQCFVCTDADEGCQDELTSLDIEFIRDCKGGPDTTVPVGCQILIGQYDYPEKTYFYRDCLYEHYIKCHLKDYEAIGDGYVFKLREWITCLNSVRSYLGLPSHSIDRLPDEDSRPVTVLYFKSGETARGQAEVIKRIDQQDMSNGEAITDLIKQPTPPDFKINSSFNCFNCDTRQVMEDGHSCDYAANSVPLLPSHECRAPTNDSYGCLMLYEEDKNSKTKWVRRECWYKGELYCLKGLSMPLSGRSMKSCNKPGGSCKARVLIQEGNQVFWNGKREFNTEKDYEDFRSCVRKIRLEQNDNDGLPELPEFDPSNAPIVFHYSFCAGEGECNGKGTPNFIPLPPPTHPPTTTTEPATTDFIEPTTTASIESTESDNITNITTTAPRVPQCYPLGECPFGLTEEEAIMVLAGAGIVLALFICMCVCWCRKKQKQRNQVAAPVVLNEIESISQQHDKAKPSESIMELGQGGLPQVTKSTETKGQQNPGLAQVNPAESQRQLNPGALPPGTPGVNPADRQQYQMALPPMAAGAWQQRYPASPPPLSPMGSPGNMQLQQQFQTALAQMANQNQPQPKIEITMESTEDTDYSRHRSRRGHKKKKKKKKKHKR